MTLSRSCIVLRLRANQLAPVRTAVVLLFVLPLEVSSFPVWSSDMFVFRSLYSVAENRRRKRVHGPTENLPNFSANASLKLVINLISSTSWRNLQ